MPCGEWVRAWASEEQSIQKSVDWGYLQNTVEKWQSSSKHVVKYPWIGKQWGGGELNKRVWFLYWPIHEEHGERLHIFVSSICWQLVRFCGPDKEQVSLQIQRSKGYIRVKRKTTIVYIQLHKAYWRIKGSDWKACQTEPCGQVYSSESFTKLLRK